MTAFAQNVDPKLGSYKLNYPSSTYSPRQFAKPEKAAKTHGRNVLLGNLTALDCRHTEAKAVVVDKSKATTLTSTWFDRHHGPISLCAFDRITVHW